jgi:cytochrome c
LVALVLAALASASCSPRQEAMEPHVADLPLPSQAGAAAVARLAPPYNSGDPFEGQRQFGDCAACHSVSAEGSGEKGPSLRDIYGQPAGHDPAFGYSEALRASGILWDEKRLDQWLFNPHETLPGTTMSYIGIRNDTRRRNVIAYLVALAVP